MACNATIGTRKERERETRHESMRGVKKSGNRVSTASHLVSLFSHLSSPPLLVLVVAYRLNLIPFVALHPLFAVAETRSANFGPDCRRCLPHMSFAGDSGHP